MVNFTILAGGFSTFIATYVFDSDAGSLSVITENPTGPDPSWISFHHTQKNIVYAVNEGSEPPGALQSFLVDEAGTLTLVGTAESGGDGPTYVGSLSTGEIVGCNYGSPSVGFATTDPNDPSILLESSVVNFPVPESAENHPHMSLEYKGEVLVADLGANKIWRVGKDDTGQFQLHGQIDIEVGNGPRHMAIKDDILFVINESSSTLSAHRIPEGPNGTTIAPLASVSILPSDAASGPNADWKAAEILISEISEDFPDPLIYVSNRDYGTDEPDSRGDTIAIFEFSIEGAAPVEPRAVEPSKVTPVAARDVAGGAFRRGHSGAMAKRMSTIHARHNNLRRGEEEGTKGIVCVETDVPTTGNSTTEVIPGENSGVITDDVSDAGSPTVTLTLVGHVYTGLRQVRSFAIGPTAKKGGDEFLIAGATEENGVAVFRRIQGGRNLTEVARDTTYLERTSFLFL